MNDKILEQLPNKNKDWFKRLIKLRNETQEIFNKLNDKQALLQYETNKWTLKELLDHLTECEKIFNYRALRFSKKENLELPGFNENLFVTNGNSNNQPLSILITEFNLTRQNSLYFFGKLSNEELGIVGKANGN